MKRNRKELLQEIISISKLQMKDTSTIDIPKEISKDSLSLSCMSKKELKSLRDRLLSNVNY